MSVKVVLGLGGRDPTICGSLILRHFALGTGERCHPLTMTDQFWRYLIKCEALEKPNFESAWLCLERAFHEIGMLSRLRTDNSPPFATGTGELSTMAVSLIRLGVMLERIDPGHPKRNSCQERMHKTLKQESTLPPDKNFIAQSAPARAVSK